ncbi:hypothetical protein [Nocardia inohanensis]|uniref:hypothetical protein n=1 Tax=Nocardia inohanensis TaxID=209246 RepID=UPI00082F8BCE|nr:hypothetical protein [Nocardia inohanensis]
MKVTPASRIGIGIAGLAVAAGTALVVGNSPEAAATVDTISISSTELVAGQTYSLHAALSGASVGLLVYWNDNGENLTPAGKVPWPPGEANFDWTPKTTGQHVITASQGGSTKSVVVFVTDGSGTTTPPTTTPPTTAPTTPPVTTEPTTPPTTTTKPSSGSGGLGSGSGGSGSAGKILGGLLGSS